MVSIIDYDLGNTGSIINMLKKLGYTATLTRDIPDLESSELIILPGVGTFDQGITNLKKYGLYDYLSNNHIGTKKILGICLGAQLLLDGSEEGKLKGLGLIPGISKKFKNENNFNNIHMGWNQISWCSKLGKKLLNPESKFYFVHGYHMEVTSQFQLFKTIFQNEFISGIKRNNIIGVQFHPEKSHIHGMSFLDKFLKNELK